MGEFLVVIAVIWGIFVTLFWMFIGWRAVVAHEEMSAAIKELARRGSTRDDRAT
ncbi:MAG: hypothetical protein R3F29_07985 [Planctomycetota bacterium]